MFFCRRAPHHDSYSMHVSSYIEKTVDFEKFQHIVQQLGLYWLVVNQPAPVTEPKSVASR